jgi:hypothetical protein
VTILHRVLALAFGLLLGGGYVFACEDLAATPEARMACCADGGDCPMHQGESSHRSGRTLTQAQADACCTMSGRDQSNQASPSALAAVSGAVLGNGIIVPASVPMLVLSDGWRTASPLPTAQVPRHLLLSVLLGSTSSEHCR